jgi:hypothetical protein
MTLPIATPVNKALVLGTALWGWGVNRATAFQILDRFVMLGGRIVDTASNWIGEWIAVNGAAVLSVLVKIGATDNMGESEVNLTSSFIQQSADNFRDRFGNALSALSVHWDNRGDNVSDVDAIAESVAALSQLHLLGISIGFSGVRHPELYLKAAPSLADKWWIQVKENIQTNAARQHYFSTFPNAHYLAYGINMGGIKLSLPAENSSVSLRNIKRPDAMIDQLSKYINSDHGLLPAPTNLNELALTMGFLNTALSGIIVGPSTLNQITNTMDYWAKLKVESTADMATLIPGYRDRA